jgi:ATP-binding cassette subfamily F protein 3
LGRFIGEICAKLHPSFDIPQARDGTSSLYACTVAVLIASGLRKELNGTPLFDGVALTVNRRDRVALAGQNGAGKTTLLRAIAGEVALQAGEVVLSKGAKVALHDQRPPLENGLSLETYVLGGAKELVAVEARLRELELAMAGGTHDEATLRRYAEAQARLEHAGGYMWRERVTAVLRGLGFADEQLERPLASFSGGEITRASLARALAGDPDLLLLDEPTNHLDVASLEWLERELQTLDAAVVLVAHDRWFLEAVGTAVLELDNGKSTFFAGPWHAYRQEMAARASLQATMAKRQEEELERLEHFVARFRYGTKARQAQSRLKQIDRLQATRVEAPKAKARGLGFEFLKPPRSGRTVVEARGLVLSVPGRDLVREGDFAIERGEHVALVGPNGAGKTTLLETIVGTRKVQSGELRTGHGVEIAYFSQHERELDERGSVLDCAAGATKLPRSQAQALLGRFAFSGLDAQEKPVAALSGGERRRLALAIVVASGANFLVLDEPTNHLDLESREALEVALERFPGTLLLVSHDRALLDAVAERTLALEDGTIRSYPGGWADLMRRREEHARAALPPAAPRPKKDRPARPVAKRPSELDRLETDIARRETKLKELEASLASDWTNADLVAEHRRAREELDALLGRWEALAT